VGLHGVVESFELQRADWLRFSEGGHIHWATLFISTILVGIARIVCQMHDS
jgi:hypothetical protein